MSGLPDRLLLIDESDDIVHGGRKYVVACAVVLAGDAQAVEARLRHVLAANPDRTRPFHWSTEGPELRTQMIEAVASLAEVSFAVIGEVVGSRGQELVRYDCMRALQAGWWRRCQNCDREPGADAAQRRSEPHRPSRDRRCQTRGGCLSAASVSLGRQDRSAGVGARRHRRNGTGNPTLERELARTVRRCRWGPANGRHHPLARMSPGSRDHPDGCRRLLRDPTSAPPYRSGKPRYHRVRQERQHIWASHAAAIPLIRPLYLAEGIRMSPDSLPKGVTKSTFRRHVSLEV